MNSKIDTLIAEFAKNLRVAIAEEAAAAFVAVARGGGGQPDPLFVGRRKPGPKPKAAKAAAKAKGGRIRRSPEDIEKQAAQILAYIKKNPGSKAETIGAALGLSSLEMQIPMAKLLEEGSAKKRGQRRATVYSPK